MKESVESHNNLLNKNRKDKTEDIERESQKRNLLLMSANQVLDYYLSFKVYINNSPLKLRF